MIDHIVRGLRGSAARGYTARPYDAARHIDMTREALFLLRLYYAVSVVVAFRLIPDIWDIALTTPAIEPRWPVLWVSQGILKPAATVLLTALMASAVLAALAWHNRWARLAFAVLLLENVALEFSFGYTNNFYHIWLWMGIGFVFMPNARPEVILADRRLRYRALMAMAWTTALVLLFYTLSGLAKLAGAVPTGPHNYSTLLPYALANHVAARMLLTDEVTVLGQLLTQMPALGWPAFLAVIYIEVFAIHALFRPALLRVFGVFLLVFHVGIWFFMGIQFYLQPLQMLMLLVWSPFRPRRQGVRETLEQLPGIGSVLYWRRVRPGPGLAVFWWREEWPTALVMAVLGLVDLGPKLIERVLA